MESPWCCYPCFVSILWYRQGSFQYCILKLCYTSGLILEWKIRSHLFSAYAEVQHCLAGLKSKQFLIYAQFLCGLRLNMGLVCVIYFILGGRRRGWRLRDAKFRELFQLQYPPSISFRLKYDALSINQGWLQIPVLPSCDTIVLPAFEMLDVTSVLSLLCLFQLAVLSYVFYFLLISETIALYSYTLSQFLCLPYIFPHGRFDCVHSKLISERIYVYFYFLGKTVLVILHVSLVTMSISLTRMASRIRNGCNIFGICLIH